MRQKDTKFDPISKQRKGEAFFVKVEQVLLSKKTQDGNEI